MKFKDSMIAWAFILSLIMMLLLIGDFLALHDIKQDYLSSDVLDTFKNDLSNEIPEWASAKLEWTFMKVSLLLKVIITPVIVIALAQTSRKLKL